MERKLTPTNGSAKHPAAEAPEEADSELLEREELERIERVWNERAAQMAKVDTSGENQGAMATVVLVRLGRELLGLDVQYVFDIRPREAITRVPRVPGWVVGVTNLRGNILSVIDLRKYFGLPGDSLSEGEHEGLLVIVQASAGEHHGQNGTMEIVFLVDDVPGVETLPIRQSAAESGMIHSLRPEYIQFIGERQSEETTGADSEADDSLAQRHVVVLNVENLLTDPRLIVHEEIA